MRVAFVGLAAAAVAGCSAESNRFDNAFSNPFASKNARGSDVTGSVPAVQPAPAGRVESRPLQYSAQTLPPPTAHRPATTPSHGQSGGGRGLASYTPANYAPAPAPATRPAGVASDVTGTVQPLPPPPATRTSTPSGWNWDGGSAVVVGPGENLDSLARKYGVPGHAILQANGFSSAAAIQPGQRIVIPRYNHSQSAAAQPARLQAPASQPARPPQRAAAAPAASSAGTVHVVAPGETLMAISRRYRRPVSEIAAANGIPPHTLIKIGDRIVIPGHVAAARTAPAAAARPPLPPARAQAPVQHTAALDKPSSARVATPAPEAKDDDDPAPVAGGGSPQFRWPVRGRVIATFGAKPNGQHNDGINLAVPEGTAIRSAEDGVVAYAGNELKGYGNLILVRHANGYVTAYAHASEIMVKRNDQVRRGQVIAKSGQSGSVTTPQLHFEIRKGSAPVDPSRYLPAG